MYAAAAVFIVSFFVAVCLGDNNYRLLAVLYSVVHHVTAGSNRIAPYTLILILMLITSFMTTSYFIQEYVMCFPSSLFATIITINKSCYSLHYYSIQYLPPLGHWRCPMGIYRRPSGLVGNLDTC